MDGRLLTVLISLVLPAALIGVTVVEFHSNPVAVLGLLAVMVAGAFYLVSYTESVAGPAQGAGSISRTYPGSGRGSPQAPVHRGATS